MSRWIVIALLVLLVGIFIPKIVIKNPDLGSNSCTAIASQDMPKFPASLILTPKVESFTVSEVDITYYTLFGIKTGKHRMIFCTLIGK